MGCSAAIGIPISFPRQTAGRLGAGGGRGAAVWRRHVVGEQELAPDAAGRFAAKLPGDGIHSGKPMASPTRRFRQPKWPVHQMTRGDPAADREQAHLPIRRHPESGVDACSSTRFTPPAWPTATKWPAPSLSPAFTITPPSRGFAVAGAGGRATSRFGQPHDPALRGQR